MDDARNRPCPCGSGRKFEFCCGAARRRLPWFAGAAAVALVVLGAWAVTWRMRGSDTPGPEASHEQPAEGGSKWSADGTHLHRPAPAPDGPAPPGKVWSLEHGHWHDLPQGQAAPEGAAEPGKVWSEEHGHWHDPAK